MHLLKLDLVTEPKLIKHQIRFSVGCFNKLIAFINW